MDVIQIAGVAMQKDLAGLNVISQNIANITTPGYKKQISPVFHSQVNAALQGLAAPSYAGQPAIDMAPGPLRPTGNSNDVALEGDGFFELVTPSGPAYTRQGALHVNVDGVLAATQGLPVASLSGGPLQLLNLPFAIAANGDVSQGGRVIGQLKVVQFEQASTMQAMGAGLYAQGGARLAPQAVRTATVRAGFLEGSNVSSPQEMVRLSETVRHFESLQRIVQGYDESLEKAIRKLGEF
jgi:flagellar basal-body rod protein FlgF